MKILSLFSKSITNELLKIKWGLRKRAMRFYGSDKNIKWINLPKRRLSIIIIMFSESIINGRTLIIDLSYVGGLTLNPGWVKWNTYIFSGHIQRKYIISLNFTTWTKLASRWIVSNSST